MNARVPRKTHNWQVVGLSASQLRLARKLTGYSGPPGLPLFEEAVWWWRPLLQILGPRAHAIEVPEESRRRFFPASVFREMRAAEAGGGLHDILTFWFNEELAARLDGAQSHWPAYTIDTSRARLPEWETLHVRELPARSVDLRWTDSELLRVILDDLKQLRAQRREDAPWPMDDRIRKSSYLSAHTFAVIELIDRKKLGIGRPVTEGEWANVNKAVRQRGPYLFRR